MKVAFCGKMASGKTSIAEKLMRENQNSQKYSFAGAVKDFSRFVYDIPENYKDRIKFQKVGDGARKYISPDVWIDAVLHKSKSAPFLENQFLDDARYRNEVIKLKEEGWTVILLDIEDELQIQRLKTTYPEDWNVHVDARSHPSEKGIEDIERDLFDLVVNVVNGDQNYEEIKSFLTVKEEDKHLRLC